jgi:flagellar assembly factor FliW
VVRKNLNYSAECRQKNDFLFREGILTFEEWEATDRLHHAREANILSMIREIPPEERQELAQLLRRPYELESQTLSSPPEQTSSPA